MKITKRLAASILLFIVIFALFGYVKRGTTLKPFSTQNTPPKHSSSTNSYEFCFLSKEAYSDTSLNLYDKQILTFTLGQTTQDGRQTASGTYAFLPAEKDSKAGSFTGTVGKMNPNISGRLIDAVWNSTAEGMANNEELLIQFGEGSAVAFFGEMAESKDGLYVYKNKNDVQPGSSMYQTDCSNPEIRTR